MSRAAELLRTFTVLGALLYATHPEVAAAQTASGRESEKPEEKTPPGPVVLANNEKLSVRLSGRVHRMILGVEDGRETSILFTDSEQGPTMLKIDAEARSGEALKLGSVLEVGIRQNRPFKVSQDEPDGGTDITVRRAEVFLESARVGTFRLGRGFAAAWLAPEVDLSGTQFASLLPVGMLAPGLKFADASTGELSEIRVRDHFVDVERLLLVDRIRYDSPRLAGLRVSGSVASDKRWDVALRSRHAPGRWLVVGGASYQDKPFAGIEDRFDGAVSARHEATGLNLTVGASRETLTRGGRATSFVVKAGWLADLVKLGKTAFSLDYFLVQDLRVDGDEAPSFGVFAVQKWTAVGLDFYVGWRRYEVDRPDRRLEPLHVVPFGVVFSF